MFATLTSLLYSCVQQYSACIVYINDREFEYAECTYVACLQSTPIQLRTALQSVGRSLMFYVYRDSK